MRTIKLASALITLLALTSIAAATANAAETLWQWLPGTTGTTFLGRSGEVLLAENGGGSFICTSSDFVGVLTAEQTLGLATIEFKGCKAEGPIVPKILGGNATETILVHAELHNCVISSGHAGILVKLLPLHAELLEELRLIEGSFVTEVTPDKKAAKEFGLNIKQKEGRPEIEKCEGGSAETLTIETNESGKKIGLAEEARESTFTFKENEEAMA